MFSNRGRRVRGRRDNITADVWQTDKKQSRELQSTIPRTSSADTKNSSSPSTGRFTAPGNWTAGGSKCHTQQAHGDQTDRQKKCGGMKCYRVYFHILDFIIVCISLCVALVSFIFSFFQSCFLLFASNSNSRLFISARRTRIIM